MKIWTLQSNPDGYIFWGTKLHSGNKLLQISVNNSYASNTLYHLQSISCPSCETVYELVDANGFDIQKPIEMICNKCKTAFDIFITYSTITRKK